MGCVSIWSDKCLCLWGCFWTRLAFKLIDWVKQIVLHNVYGSPQTAEGLNKTKRRTLLWVGGDSSCLTTFELGHWYFFSFELKHQLFLDLEAMAIRLEPHHGSSASAAYRVWVLELVSPLITWTNSYICVCVCTYPVDSVSLQNPDALTMKYSTHGLKGCHDQASACFSNV